MDEAQAISQPRGASDYPGREADCIAALRPAVSELAATSQESIVAAMGGELTGELLELAHRAEEAGWTADEASAAIEVLAREYEGAKGTIFD
ncbi:hypothetical protein [Sinorhizobium saheli]|uniref:Uncharacterized protein n=1 Tax=Sinorhizobium saheli TaxID=36856 RepID=A0A178YSK2_SINSA|nr:hypothetical protein [Sinorhizobium saheli]MQW88307.1 hypothetical protein [Sinorhizobium saheli]OAP50434.1 hypothetical protein ATB98_09460 [Sinorhizobium saheli]